MGGAALLGLLLSLTQASAAPNVVLISLDTTRADALSCYGRLPGLHESAPVELTPHLDALAREGLRFEHFYAAAPTTVSSHATLFTGLDPHQHAIPRNGFPLAEQHTTLASRLQAGGWDTIAVLGSSVLSREVGLHRGFRLYDDDVSNGLSAEEDTADEVLERVLRALDARPDASKPLFLFAHFYDAHAPYLHHGEASTALLPPEYTGTFAEGMVGRLLPLRRAIVDREADPLDIAAVNGLYQGEVSYVDAQIGELLSALQARGLLESALVVVVGDHGESLHTNPTLAYTHGAAVTEDVTHVPLILRAYGDEVLLRRGVTRRHANMPCLAPTLERLAGLNSEAAPACWELVRPGPVNDADGWPEHPTPTLFAEATRPHLDPPSTWNNIDLRRSARVGELQLLVGRHAGEPPTLAGLHDRGEARWALRSLLEQKLAAWDAVAPTAREDAPQGALLQLLEALGYVDEPTSTTP